MVPVDEQAQDLIGGRNFRCHLTYNDPVGRLTCWSWPLLFKLPGSFAPNLLEKILREIAAPSRDAAPPDLRISGCQGQYFRQGRLTQPGRALSDAAMGMPISLYLKSRLLGSPLEAAARRLQSLSSIKAIALNPEVSDIFLESKRIEIILRRLMAPDSNCIDVGCHIGSFLSLLLDICPNGKHLAIEPSSVKSAWLAKKFPAVDVLSIAVGDKNETLTFHENLQRPGFSRLRQATAGRSISYPVAVKRLDDILGDRPIDLLKIDVEGGEYNALLGSPRLIERCKPILLFECGSEHDLDEVSVSRRKLYDLITSSYNYNMFTLPDFIYGKGCLSFDEFRKCGLFPFRAFNYIATTNDS